MTHPVALQALRRVILPLALVWGTALANAAPDLDEALGKFQVDLPAPSTASVTAGNDSLRAAQGQVVQLSGYLTREDYRNAINQARQYLAGSTDPEIRKLWSDLITAIRAKQKEVEDVQIAEITTALKTANTKLIAATKSADIEPIIEALHVVQDGLQNNYESRLQRMRSKLSGAISFCGQWQSMIELIEEGEIEDARYQFKNFVSNNSSDRLLSRTEIKKLGRTLKLDETDATLVSAEADALIAKAAKVALAATTANELEPVMQELEDFRQNYNRYSGSINRITSRVSNVISFFQRWQDALAAAEVGNYEDARYQLRNLASSGYNNRPLTRQQVIAKATEFAVPAEDSVNLLAGATLDNLADYRERIAFAQEMANGRHSTQLSNALNEIDNFISATEALDQGLAGDGLGEMKTTRSSCGTRGTGSLEDTLGALKSAWFARALPALTGIQDLPPYSENEDTLSYVRRQFDAAIEAADWEHAYRFVKLEHDMRPQTTSCAIREQTAGANPLKAIKAWLDGNLLESATQTEAAVVLYQDALKAGAPPKLQAVIVAKLRAMAGAASAE
ncbi:MAG: hypothetical protein ABII82_00565 [Verrucomicrobiota bacterium]